MEMGGTTAMLLHCSGSWPECSALVAKCWSFSLNAIVRVYCSVCVWEPTEVELNVTTSTEPTNEFYSDSCLPCVSRSLKEGRVATRRSVGQGATVLLGGSRSNHCNRTESGNCGVVGGGGLYFYPLYFYPHLRDRGKSSLTPVYEIIPWKQKRRKKRES